MPESKYETALAFLRQHPEGLSGLEIADHAGIYFDHFQRTLKRNGIMIFSKPTPSAGGKGAKKLYSLTPL
jgi:hypothetical protein